MPWVRAEILSTKKVPQKWFRVIYHEAAAVRSCVTTTPMFKCAVLGSLSAILVSGQLCAYPKSLIKIALMGDSLMNQACNYLKLADKINEELIKINDNIPFNIVYSSFADGGCAIADVREKQMWPVVNYQPNGTILLWDTDVSGVDETVMSTEEVDTLREQFKTDVRVVTSTILNHTSSRMALAGPGILGEDRVLKSAEYVFLLSLVSK